MKSPGRTPRRRPRPRKPGRPSAAACLRAFRSAAADNLPACRRAVASLRVSRRAVDNLQVSRRAAGNLRVNRRARP
jgi:hypothetical protein